MPTVIFIQRTADRYGRDRILYPVRSAETGMPLSFTFMYAAAMISDGFSSFAAVKPKFSAEDSFTAGSATASGIFRHLQIAETSNIYSHTQEEAQAMISDAASSKFDFSGKKK